MRRKSEKMRRATEIATKYQRQEGRHKIRVKVLMAPTGDLFYHWLLCSYVVFLHDFCTLCKYSDLLAY